MVRCEKSVGRRGEGGWRKRREGWWRTRREGRKV
jgi:hypothetical protein